MKDYDSITEWAKEIREKKIEELQNLIAFKKEILMPYMEIANFTTTSGQFLITKRKLELIAEICRLKDKLNILIK